MTGVEKVRGAIKHPAFVVVVAALAVRLVLVPLLTYDYDIYHWAQIIQNIQTGDGLYDVDAYYYTPTWGYILGFISQVMDALGLADTFGVRFTELLAVEDLSFRYHTATTVTLAFAACMKIPIIIADLACGYLIHRIIREDTGDERKAVAGLALWLLCPSIIYMSGIQAQFDSFSALLLLLTFMLLRSNRELLAGMTFAAGVLLKFFPAFAIIVLVGYVIAKHRGDGLALKKLAKAVVGAGLMTLVMYLPIIMDGDLETSLSFVLGRNSELSSNIIVMIGEYILIAFALVGMVACGHLMLRTPREEAEDRFPVLMLLVMTCAVMMSPSPQYMIVMLPFLVIAIMRYDGRLRLAWLLIWVGSVLMALGNNNFMLLNGASVFLDLGSPEWVVSLSEAFDTLLYEGFLRIAANGVGSVVQYAGYVLVLLICCEEGVRRRWPGLADALDGLKGWDWERKGPSDSS